MRRVFLCLYGHSTAPARNTQTRIGVTPARRMRHARICAPAPAICLYDYLTARTCYYI